MLLPALSAAREKARRTACLSNLSQLAQGLESYCGDYGQYFPSWPAYGGMTDNCYYPYYAIAVSYYDAGVVSDDRRTPASDPLRTGYAIRYSNGWAEQRPYTLPINYFRTIYTGSADMDDQGEGADPIRAKGERNMAAVGLGYLLDGGYLGDARVFFCPTAGDNMPADSGMNQHGEPMPGVSAPRDLQRAGGFDARTMSHGDWTWASQWRTWVRIYWLFIQANYNYRNVPVAGLSHMGFTYDQQPVPARMSLVSPDLAITPGQPPFKTQKLLASRALVADSFSQADAWWDAARLFPGKGFYAHRDGYNVLYGDWSGKWYGDPQQRLLWWPANVNGSSEYPWFLGSLQLNGVVSWTSLDGTAGPYGWFQAWCDANVHDSVKAWHILDMANGVDVGVNK